MIVLTKYHPLICKLNATLSYMLLRNILISTEISYCRVMYYPMFMKLCCALVYFEGLWSYAIVNLENLFSIRKSSPYPFGPVSFHGTLA